MQMSCARDARALAKVSKPLAVGRVTATKIDIVSPGYAEYVYRNGALELQSDIAGSGGSSGGGSSGGSSGVGINVGNNVDCLLRELCTTLFITGRNR
jgi:hypothetical protein